MRGNANANANANGEEWWGCPAWIIHTGCVILRSVSDEESIEILRSAQNDRVSAMYSEYE